MGICVLPDFFPKELMVALVKITDARREMFSLIYKMSRLTIVLGRNEERSDFLDRLASIDNTLKEFLLFDVAGDESRVLYHIPKDEDIAAALESVAKAKEEVEATFAILLKDIESINSATPMTGE